MTTKNLLVELLVEELPPKSLEKLGESFATTLTRELSKEGLLEAGSITTPYASPRRLAAHITNVREKAPTKRVRKKLMPVSVAFEDGGNQSSALKKRLEKEGYSDSDLFREMEGNTEYVFIDFEEGGWSLSPLLNLAFRFALSQLPIPKVMGYQLQDGWTTVNFVRPAHKLVALHGGDVVEIDALGLQAGRETQGHRFEAKSNPIMLKNADSYAQQLETEGAVMASFAARRAEIAKQIAAVAAREKLKPIDDEVLLDEVTALVERPNVLVGQFEKEFLEVPPECLILTMKANQKYFPLLDAQGKLTNKFLIVSNIRPDDASLVIGGNERVVRPRLADAKFFFDQDRKKTLGSRVGGLSKVVYHNKMGVANDMLSRVVRVSEGAEKIGIWLGGEGLGKQAHLAASLAKADLLTDMVGEFPELQGIMGRYYAQHDRERYTQQPGITPQKSYYEKYFTEEIPFAIEDHYKPRFAGDDLPRNQVGIVVALADKLETLVGMFGIGEKPTGDKDPFALRRNALGVIRILTEGNIPLELDKLIWNAHAMLEDSGLADRAAGEKLDRMWKRDSQDAKVRKLEIETSTPDFVENWFSDLQGFIFDRFVGLLREQNFSAQEIDSVLSLRPQLLMEVPKRLAAVCSFAALPEAAALAAANKRVGNILKKADGDFALRQAQGERIEVKVDLLQEPAEHALHKALIQIAPQADAAFSAGDYAASLQALAGLRVPVDAFFDSVMVNTEDAALRTNRLALLKQLHAAMNRVADISKLAA